MKIKITRSYGFVGTDDAWQVKVPDDIAELPQESEEFQEWYKGLYYGQWDEMCERLELGLEIIEE